MNKILTILLLSFIFCSKSFAESYYFKNCKISNVVIGNYAINLKENKIDVELIAVDGKVQKFSDKIKLIEDHKIVSEKIKSAKGEDRYYQYFLNSKSKSVTKLDFKKEGNADFEVFNLFDTKKSFCTDIKSDWNKTKIEETKIDKEQKEILEAQEKIKKEQKSLIECQGQDYKKWTNCKGSYKTETDHKYKGIFKNGKILKGISLYPGGAKYVGDFKNFEPHGYGTFIWSNGDKYYGEWKNGKIHGSGTKIWKSGRKYIGQFKNDKLDGKGLLFYHDGKKYEGDFLNGKRHGQGIFTYPDGSAYVGTFIAGKEQGLGQCISKDGKTVPCKNRTDTQSKNFSGKDIRKISIVAKKWVRISQYETNTKKGKVIMGRLEVDFVSKAFELCTSKGSYNILEKRIEVLEVDETPAYGLEAKLKLGISGVVECVKK